MKTNKTWRKVIGIIGAALLLFGAGGILLPRSIVNWGLRLFLPDSLLDGGLKLTLYLAFGLVVFIAIILLACSEGSGKNE